jgi:peptidoglycan/LPS O-acetylase OafA/YrhL
MCPADPATGRDAGDGYMRQLDSLRAIAVLGVCLHHWTVDLPGSWIRGALDLVPFDAWRVQLFFALSGFLITLILLKARTKAEEADASTWRTLLVFYARRGLRTWPLFFLVLFAMAALNLRPSREELVWNAAFLTNFRVLYIDDGVGVVQHFWSLAVEEQFYLVWPWLILFPSRKAIVPALVGVAVLLNASQVCIAWELGVDRAGLHYLPGANVNTLVYGSILAVYKDHPRLHRWATALGLYVALPLAVVTMFVERTKALGPFSTTVDRIALAPLLGWVLLQTARGVKGRVGRALEWSPLVWLGTVSYGVYLIHNAPLTFLYDYYAVLGLDAIPKLRAILANEFTRVVALLAITVGLAAFAYYGFERPLNRLKRYLPYAPRGRDPRNDTPRPPAASDAHFTHRRAA